MGVGFILCFLFGIGRPSKSSQSCLLIFEKDVVFRPRVGLGPASETAASGE